MAELHKEYTFASLDERDQMMNDYIQNIQHTMKNFKLCYIDGGTAYFTTQELSKQWGDDWDDVPYESNAGTPYGPSISYYADGRQEKNPRDWNEDSTPKWEIQTVRFDCYDLESPADKGYKVNVMEINAGAVAWLYGTTKDSEGNRIHVTVLAGDTIDEFKQKIRQMGGKIYVEET